MAKNVLFLVHGMGKHEKGWSAEAGGPIATLNEIKETYPGLKGQDLTTAIEFVEIRYDDIFEAIFQRWKDTAKLLDPKDNQGADRQALVDTATNWLQDEDDGFQRSHLADVLLYRFFPFYRARIRIHVIRQIAEAINRITNEAAAAGEDVRFSVLAHSLGTIVAHDALHILGTHGWVKEDDPQPAKPNPFLADTLNFTAIFTVGNVTDILKTEFSPYSSVVHPGNPRLSSTNCFTYWNFRHELDPFAFPRTFEPIAWGGAYFPVVLRHYRDPNIHGFRHYLLHPRVHIPILNTVGGQKLISRDEWIEASRPESFPQWGGSMGTQDPEFGAKIQALKGLIGDDPDIVDWVKILLAFRKLVRDWKAAQGGGP